MKTSPFIATRWGKRPWELRKAKLPTYLSNLVGCVTPCAPLECGQTAAPKFVPRRAWSDVPHLICLWLIAVFMALSFTSLAEQGQSTNTIRFHAVDVFVNSTNKPLAAYQLEFTASPGVKIVGIEGGEHAAFKEAPFYDLKAMQHERVIIGAFSTAKADKLPVGKTRVATIHLQTTSNQPLSFEVKLKTVATVDGKKVSAQANAQEKTTQ